MRIEKPFRAIKMNENRVVHSNDNNVSSILLVAAAPPPILSSEGVGIINFDAKYRHKYGVQG
jgi:hypothetical protein